MNQLYGGKTQLTTLQALISGLGEEYTTLKDDITDCNGALNDTATTMQDNLSGDITKIKSQLEGVGIKISEIVIPTIRDFVNGISNLVDKFSKLDAGTQKQILKFTALVAAAGPVVKVVGNITSGIGNTTTAIGKMIEKIGESKKASDSLAGQTSKISTAFGAVTTALTGVVAAYAAYKIVDEYYKQKAKEQVESINEVTEAIKASNDAWLENRKAQEESVNGNLAELNHLQSLKDQLDELVDANGRVQEKDKARVQYIMNELNEALGTELKLNGDIVESYDSISDGIDKTIEAKKREILMNAFEEKLNEAVKNKAEAYNEYQQSIQATTDAQEKLNNVNKEVAGEFSGWKTVLVGVGNVWSSTSNKTKEYTETLENANKVQEDAKNKYEQSINDMLTASEALANGQEMTYEELELLWQQSATIHNSATNSQVQNLFNTLPQVINELNHYKDAYVTNGEDTAFYLQQQQQSTLDNMVATLIAETNATKELTPELQKAWKLLGEGSATDFNTAISQVEPTTRQEIESVVGILNNDTSVETAGEELGKRSIFGFKSNNFKQTGSDAATDIKTGIENNKGAFSILGSGLGSSLMSGLKSSVSSSSGAITGLISAIKGSHADGLAYVPYNGYVARLHEGERVLTKAENADYMANRINNNNNNVNVYIYPQTLDEPTLKKVSSFVEREWGRKS